VVVALVLVIIGLGTLISQRVLSGEGISVLAALVLPLIPAVGIALPRLDERLYLRAVEIGAHHAHALAIAPIELASFLFEDDLLRRVGFSLCDDYPTVLSVDVGAFN